jgi:hypothetical protein
MASHGSDLDYDDDPDYYRASAPSGRFERLSRPLIDSVRNGWQSHTNPAYHSLSSSPDNKNPGWIQIAVSVISAPRFRRYVLVYLTLLTLGWAGWVFMLSPTLKDRENLAQSLDPLQMDKGGWFGTNSLPTFDNLIQIGTLDPTLVPGAEAVADGSRSEKRLIMIGDVHGCKEERMCF